MAKTGTLFLIPSAIAENTTESVLPSYVIKLISDLDEFIVENERTARRYLKNIGYEKPLQTLVLHTLNKHTDTSEIHGFINSLLNGKDIGMLSEAGCPCIADPGAIVVMLAHEHKINVKPLVGPSSILLALIASGFNGQNFTFNGYLPIDKCRRIKKIKELESKAIREDQTQIFMETPFRNMQLFRDILSSCNPSTHLCIAADITGADELIRTRTIREWKNKSLELHKRTVIFLLYK
ncbi:MAG: SAM-dependent methyltransferase [Bacteroidales bacterium]